MATVGLRAPRVGGPQPPGIEQKQARLEEPRAGPGLAQQLGAVRLPAYRYSARLGGHERRRAGDPLAHLAHQAGHRQGRPAAPPRECWSGPIAMNLRNESTTALKGPAFVRPTEHGSPRSCERCRTSSGRAPDLGAGVWHEDCLDKFPGRFDYGLTTHRVEPPCARNTPPERPARWRRCHPRPISLPIYSRGRQLSPLAFTASSSSSGSSSGGLFWETSPSQPAAGMGHPVSHPTRSIRPVHEFLLLVHWTVGVVAEGVPMNPAVQLSDTWVGRTSGNSNRCLSSFSALHSWTSVRLRSSFSTPVCHSAYMNLEIHFRIKLPNIGERSSTS